AACATRSNRGSPTTKLDRSSPKRSGEARCSASSLHNLMSTSVMTSNTSDESLIGPSPARTARATGGRRIKKALRNDHVELRQLSPHCQWYVDATCWPMKRPRARVVLRYREFNDPITAVERIILLLPEADRGLAATRRLTRTVIISASVWRDR